VSVLQGAGRDTGKRIGVSTAGVRYEIQDTGYRIQDSG